MTFLTSPGKTYSIYSTTGGTVSADGVTVVTVVPGKQIAFVAQSEEISVSDPDAIIVEITGIGADLAGGGSATSPQVKFEVVDTLPQPGEYGVIYLVPTGEAGANKYAEWTWIEGTYEQLGTATIDLSGFAVLQGGNTFTGDQTIDGAVNVTGNQTVTGDVTVTGNQTVSKDQTISGNQTVGGTVTVTGGISVTGNSTIEGDVEFTGNQTIGGTVTVTGDVTVTGTHTVDGNQNVTGNQTVGGDVTITKDQNVTGNQTINGDQTVSGKQTVNGGQAVAGTVTITGDVTVTGKQTVDGDAAVTGDVTVSGDQTVEGNHIVSKDQTISGNQTVSGTQTIEGDVTVTGNHTVSKDQTIAGNQTVEGDVTVSGDVTTSDEFLREAQLYLQATIPSEMISGRVYDLGVLTSNQDLSTIAFKSAPGYVQTCEIWMETGDTGYTVTWPAGSVWPDETDGTPPSIVLPANTRYRFAVRDESNGTMVITKAYAYPV